MGVDGKESVFQKKGCPMIAVWCESEGIKPSKYLRVAIWEDGQAVFAKDTEKWGHSLLEGTIATYRIKLLKKALSDTGVFDLKGHCYLVPDAARVLYHRERRRQEENTLLGRA